MLAAEVERDQGHTVWERIQQSRPQRTRAALVEESSRPRLAPPLSMDSTDEDITRQVQVRSALQALLEKQRTAAVEGPLREQFGDDLRTLTDAEQDSKQLKSAKRQLLFERIGEELRLPFPAGPVAADGEKEMKDNPSTRS